MLALSTPEKIAAVQDLLDAFRGDKSAQQNLSKDNELARHDRDELLNVLNTRRSSIQRATDAIWPWNDAAHRPNRKTLALPLTRPAEMSIRKHECRRVARLRKQSTTGDGNRCFEERTANRNALPNQSFPFGHQVNQASVTSSP